MDEKALTVDDHPLLDLGVLQVEFPRGIGELPSPTWLTDTLRATAEAPLSADDAVRKAVRDLLRHGGYKPAGRGKPASEFLAKAAEADSLGSINLPVDLCNATSLHSGLPISVVDLDRTVTPLRVGIADDDAAYVFNASGQEIRLTGLLCLHDAEGPCANAVKDSQRTKTHDGTTRTLCLVWGHRGLEGRTAATVQWYAQLHERAGARVKVVSVA
jgi:DNA/RNA-binding domain of Phe-tRNA-synthetase-like protein